MTASEMRLERHADRVMRCERVLAFLNVAAGLDEGCVRAFCTERMADYKVPGRVLIGREPLPRNANGKIQKAELRALALALPPLALRTR